MPSRHHSDRHRDRAVYDDDEDPYYDDAYRDRPRASRRVSRSAHEMPSADTGRSRRRRHYDDYDDISPVRPARARSLDHRSSRRDRYDDYSDSEDDRRARRRGRRDGGARDGGASRSRTRRRESQPDKSHILQAAASAAVVAGAAEAWRMRGDKTSWSKKGTRMATAAAGAAAIAAFKDGTPGDYGKKDAMGATIGGLIMNRLAHGGGRK